MKVPPSHSLPMLSITRTASLVGAVKSMHHIIAVTRANQ